MNAAQWRALADEYYELARQNEKAGYTDAARYWRQAGDACRAEAKRIEQEEKSVEA